MNIELLFESEKEQIATENVLAAFRVKALNKNIDDLIKDTLNYASEIDKLLEENNLQKRYLDRVSYLNENNNISLDSDLENLDFRIKEIIEDYIKRINTRISLINQADTNLNVIESSYDLNDIDLEAEISVARLTEKDFT